MDEEREWLRRHGAKRRLNQMRYRRGLRLNAAIATLLRRLTQIISVFGLLLMLVSLVLNWSKPGMVTQLLGGILGLLLLNGFMLGMEWLFRHFASDVELK
jgi:hypothetical protein